MNIATSLISSCLAVSNGPFINSRQVRTGGIFKGRLRPALHSPHLSRAIYVPKRRLHPSSGTPCCIMPPLVNASSCGRGVANCSLLGRIRVSCANDLSTRFGKTAPTVRFHCTSVLLGCTRTLTRLSNIKGTRGVVSTLRPLHSHMNVPPISFSERCGRRTSCNFHGLSGCVRTMHHRHQIRGTYRKHHRRSVVH